MRLIITRPGVTDAVTIDIPAEGCDVAVRPDPVVPPPPPPPPPDPPPPDPPPTSGTVLARMDASRGWPACGVEPWMSGVGRYYDIEQVGNGARFRLRPGSTQAQFYLGWLLPLGNYTGPAIYIRFHLTIHAPFNASGVGDVWTDKLIIVNNGGSTRAIGELRPVRTNTDVTIGIQKNIDGGVTLTPRQNLVIGQRYAVQMRVSRGSAVRFAQWLNNPNEAAPTSESGTFSYNPAAFTNVGLGFYSNAALASGGSVDFTIENGAVWTAFDPTFR